MSLEVGVIMTLQRRDMILARHTHTPGFLVTNSACKTDPSWGAESERLQITVGIGMGGKNKKQVSQHTRAAYVRKKSRARLGNLA